MFAFPAVAILAPFVVGESNPRITFMAPKLSPTLDLHEVPPAIRGIILLEVSNPFSQFFPRIFVNRIVRFLVGWRPELEFVKAKSTFPTVTIPMNPAITFRAAPISKPS